MRVGMDFKPRTFKVIFSVIVGLIFGGFTYFVSNLCVIGACDWQALTFLPIGVFIFMAGLLYLIQSLF